MSERATEAASRETGAIEQVAPSVAVRMVRLSGRPLEGTPAPLRGRGRLALTAQALVLHYRRPLAELPEWAVGMIVGGAVVYYVLFGRLLGHVLPAATTSTEAGPLVPAMAAALATWMVVRTVGPGRAEQLRLGNEDVQALMLDPARGRVLVQSRMGMLLGLEVLGSFEPMQRYVEQRWPRALRDGTIRAHYIGRRAIVLLAVVVAVVFLLWLAPQ